MDTIIILALIFIVVVALAPFMLMRGQFGKPKNRKAGVGDSGDATLVSASAASGSGGGKAKGHSSDHDGGGSSDGGGDGGGGGD